MPVTKLAFKPGINRDATAYANEGTYFESAWARFRSGYPEKIGGWRNINFSDSYKGVARSLYAWSVQSGIKLLGFGTNQKYYVEHASTYHDITPLGEIQALGSDPFAFENLGRLVIVRDTAHGKVPGTWVTFSGMVPVAGLDLNGSYEVLAIVDVDHYTIASRTPANITGVGGGSAVTATYQINAGKAVVVSATGWGSGGWGLNGWGMTPLTSGEEGSAGGGVRLWSQTRYGDDLIMAYRDGPIYFWDVDLGNFSPAVQLGAKALTLGKVVATYEAGSGVVLQMVDASSIYAGQVILAGTGVSPGTYVLAVNYVTQEVALSQPVTTPGGDYIFSHVGAAVPKKTKFVFSADSSKFIVALGANPFDPTDYDTEFNPMLVRWSDQDNAFEWIPEQGNQAGEQPMTLGSTLVTAVNTRQEILLWSDAALYNMQYVGPPYVFGFTLLADNISIASQNAVASSHGVQYWMGNDKFYIYNGRVEPLPCPLLHHVFQNLNYVQRDLVVSGTNEGFNEVWWHYPTGNKAYNDAYVIFNYLENVWSYGSLMRTAWLDSPLREHPMAAFGVQNTVLSAGVLSIDQQIPVLDSYSFPDSGTILIDDEQITYDGKSLTELHVTQRGANGTIAAAHAAYTPVNFGVTNQIMEHEVGYDDASLPVTKPIYAAIGTADFDIGDGHQFAFVTRVLPDLSFLNSTTEPPGQPRAFLTVKARVNSGREYGYLNPKDVFRSVTYPVEQYTGQVYTRLRGRQLQFLLESNELGVAWQMGTMRLDLRPDGRKV